MCTEIYRIPKWPEVPLVILSKATQKIALLIDAPEGGRSWKIQVGENEVLTCSKRYVRKHYQIVSA